MGITLSLLAARQNPAQHTVVMWSGTDPSAKTLVMVVARRRLDPDELEQAVTAGHAEADVVRFAASVGAVQDDLSPAGEPRYYGILSALADGTYKAARFRAGAMSELPEGTVAYSSVGGKPLVSGAPPAPAAAPTRSLAPPADSAPAPPSAGPTRGPFAGTSPAAVTSGPVRGAFAATEARPSEPHPVESAPTRGPFAASPAAAPSVDPMEARRAAQARAQAQAAALANDGAAPVPSTDAQDARRAAQLRAQQAAGGRAGGDDTARRAAQRRASEPALEQVAPPSEFPIAQFGLPMTGASQSWDGLRVLWESEGKPAAAYEVVIADHPLSPDEVGELLRGQPIGGARVAAFPAGVKTVIDNITEREARAYFGVIARDEDGSRDVVGSVAQSSDECQVRKAPFFNRTAVDEVRALASGQLREARIQLMLFQEEQDVGAWREGLRLVGDALLIYPDLPAALELEAEIRAARPV